MTFPAPASRPRPVRPADPRPVRRAHLVRSAPAGVLSLAALLLSGGPTVAAAQDANVRLPADSIERLLESAPFEVLDWRGARAVGDRTSRVTVQFADSSLIAVKFAPAPPGGQTFNNNPRYEVAAYELQKLFLDAPDMVVPPTVLRAFDGDRYAAWDPDAPPTFDGSDDVLAVLQYWLFNVTGGEGYWDERRFERDTAYARHVANFNILTYLIRHRDMNEGNYLISTDSANPRVFSVDNGIAFDSERSNRGDAWRNLRVERLPAETVERLRGVTRDSLTRQLETLAQFRFTPDRRLVRMNPTPNIDPGRGIRKSEAFVQLGLREREIEDIWERIEDLLEEVEEGDIRVF